MKKTRMRNPRRQPKQHGSLKDRVKAIVTALQLKNVEQDADPRSARLLARLRDYNLLAGPEERHGFQQRQTMNRYPYGRM